MDLASKNMKVVMILFVVGALVIILKGSVKRLEELKINGKEGVCSIIKIGQNTGKSPGDMRKLAITQIPVKNYQLKRVFKTPKGVK